MDASEQYGDKKESVQHDLVDYRRRYVRHSAGVYRRGLVAHMEIEHGGQRMRRFELVRAIDPLNISGTGIVAEGVEFTDGTVAMRWRTKYASLTIWDNMEQVEAVHCHGGNSYVEWIDEQQKGDAVVLSVYEANTNTLPSQLCWGIVCRQGSHELGLVWLQEWGSPPNVGEHIRIEVDAMMAVKRASIIRKASE